MIFKPSYYDNFSCLGADCKYTCCQGWNIYLSKNEYTHIKNFKKTKEIELLCSKAFQRIKKNATQRKYATVNFDSHSNCILLSEDGLCSLQLSCGHKALPITCKNFPRNLNFTEFENEDVLEQHLSLGCEAVLKLIMQQKDGITFETLPEESIKNRKHRYITHAISSSDAKERPVYQYVWDLKTLGLGILQNRDYSLINRILLLGIALNSIDEMEKKGEESNIPSFVDQFLAIIEHDSSLLDSFSNTKENQNFQIVNAIFLFDQICNQNKMMNSLRTRIFDNLGIEKNGGEVSIEPFENHMKITVGDVTIKIDEKKYFNGLNRFDNFFQGREYILENIMLTYFFVNNQPFYLKDRSIWQHFLFFASVYNLFKFTIMGYLTEDNAEDDFIYATTICSRSLTHSKQIFDNIVSELEKNQSDTLAHMAILVK